jgi:hypothetical protein
MVRKAKKEELKITDQDSTIHVSASKLKINRYIVDLLLRIPAGY